MKYTPVVIPCPPGAQIRVAVSGELLPLLAIIRWCPVLDDDDEDYWEWQKYVELLDMKFIYVSDGLFLFADEVNEMRGIRP